MCRLALGNRSMRRLLNNSAGKTLLVVCGVVSSNCVRAPDAQLSGLAAQQRCQQTRAVVRSADELVAVQHCTTLASLRVAGGHALQLSALTQLREVGGDVHIGPTVDLGEVQLPALARIGGALRIAGNLQLGGVYLPALTTSVDVQVTDNPTLATIAVPQLRGASSCRLARNVALEVVLTPAFHARCELRNLPQLHTWSAPAVTQARAVVEMCPRLVETQ